MNETPIKIPYTQTYFSHQVLSTVTETLASQVQAGNGPRNQACRALLTASLNTIDVLLTPSCTAALEMIALLLEIKPGDEIIMPSYTLSSTATAFALRGAVPVFVDVHPNFPNINEALIEPAITEKTRAIVVVHYAGISCAMKAIQAIADHHHLPVIEDAAQGLGSSYNDQPLGTLSSLAAVSFHQTKNISCGEGGALVINDARYQARAEMIQEKGTNRSHFISGEVNKYEWTILGSSYLMNELTAAYLYAQLQDSATVNAERARLWARYQSAFASLEAQGNLLRPTVDPACQHNGHIYFIYLADQALRERLACYLRRQGIQTATHYEPLHTTRPGQQYGRAGSNLIATEQTAQRLLRIPLYFGLSETAQDEVVSAISAFFAESSDIADNLTASDSHTIK